MMMHEAGGDLSSGDVYIALLWHGCNHTSFNESITRFTAGNSKYFCQSGFMSTSLKHE
jgi:hypothetical protein